MWQKIKSNFLYIVSGIVAIISQYKPIKEGYNEIVKDIPSVQIPQSYSLWQALFIIILLYLFYKVRTLNHNIRLLTKVSNEQSRLINEITEFFATKVELDELKPKEQNEADKLFDFPSVKPYDIRLSYRANNKAKTIITTFIINTKDSFLSLLQLGIHLYHPTVVEKSRYSIEEDEVKKED